MKTKLNHEQIKELLHTLKTRFEENMHRHEALDWNKIQIKLENDTSKLAALYKMEETGGEPDVIADEIETDEYVFYDCSPESPSGRRSLCYDLKALQSRKKFPPKSNVIDVANSMGIEILDEAQYKHLQKFGDFDLKTSSWIKTPKEIRDLGGALFCDLRFNHVFVYHNGAESYYASRGFRGLLKI